MKLEIEIPDYDGNAMDVIWEANANYAVKIFENDVIIKANAQGLISLAKQMMYMVYNNLPSGSHVHYDDFFTKLKNKYDLVIEKE